MRARACWAGVAVLAAAAAACSAPRGALEREQASPGAFAGVSYRLVEEAHDGLFEIRPGRSARGEVDANANLVLGFEREEAVSMEASPGAASPAEASPEWARVQAALATAEQLFEQRRMLNALVLEPRTDLQEGPAAGLAEIETLRLQAADLNQVAVGLALGLLDDGWTEDELFALMRDERGQTDPELVYPNLLRELGKRLVALEARRDAALDGPKLEVGVQAALKARGELARFVHVEGWDTIPSGDYEPIPRLEPRLTETERRRLAVELAQAEQAAAAIRELELRSSEIGELFGALGARLRAALEAFLASLESAEGALPAVGELNALADELEGSEAGDEAAGILRALAGDIERFAELARDARAAATSLGGGVESLAGALAVLDELGRLRAAAGELVELATNAGTNLAALGALLERLAPEIAEQVRQALVEGPLAEWIAEASASLPATAGLVAELASALAADAHAIDAAEDLASVADQLQWRQLDELVEGVIELPSSGIAVGDALAVTVRFREPGGALVHEETFHGEAVLTGWHRLFGARLIFARALEGDLAAKKFQPNAAALVEWHYRYREPQGAWERFVNGANPGLGIHAAGLDLSDEGVEVGMGLNASVFDGLLTAGFGWNLSVSEDHEYVFIGTDLFKLLSSVQVGLL